MIGKTLEWVGGSLRDECSVRRDIVQRSLGKTSKSVLEKIGKRDCYVGNKKLSEVLIDSY